MRAASMVAAALAFAIMIATLLALVACSSLPDIHGGDYVPIPDAGVDADSE